MQCALPAMGRASPVSKGLYAQGLVGGRGGVCARLVARRRGVCTRASPRQENGLKRSHMGSSFRSPRPHKLFWRDMAYLYVYFTRVAPSKPCVKVFMVIHVGGGTVVEGQGDVPIPAPLPLWTIFWVPVAKIYLRGLPDNSCLGVFVFNPLSFSFERLGVFGQKLKIRNLIIWICLTKR